MKILKIRAEVEIIAKIIAITRITILKVSFEIKI